MEESSVNTTNLNLKVLKTQNKCLAARLNSLRVKFKADSESFDASKPHIQNCIVMVDSFTNNLKRVILSLMKVFDSFKTVKELTNLKNGGSRRFDLDPIKDFTEKFPDVIAKIGHNLKASLQTGLAHNCEGFVKEFRASTLYGFQGLLADRTKFLELLAAQNTNFGMLLN